jgi:hypothetical protein
VVADLPSVVSDGETVTNGVPAIVIDGGSGE